MGLIQSTYISCELDGNAVDAKILVEKIAERESQVIQNELGQAAAPFGWKVALDAEQLTMLPSVGLGALVNLSKTCKSQGGRLAVFNLAPEILDVLKLTKLDRIITIVKDREDALKAVR
ncbi:MAG TPA: STAS domain-containing protein [Phycisphaerales bacterium]|nr:STAS domain-containing protein [Phycisphaerales bacterium]